MVDHMGGQWRKGIMQGLAQLGVGHLGSQGLVHAVHPLVPQLLIHRKGHVAHAQPGVAVLFFK